MLHNRVINFWNKSPDSDVLATTQYFYALIVEFLANVNARSRSLYVVVRPSVVCRLSVVCL